MYNENESEHQYYTHKYYNDRRNLINNYNRNQNVTKWICDLRRINYILFICIELQLFFLILSHIFMSKSIAIARKIDFQISSTYALRDDNHLLILLLVVVAAVHLPSLTLCHWQDLGSFHNILGEL